MRKKTPILVGLLVCIILTSSCSFRSNSSSPSTDIIEPPERATLEKARCMGSTSGLVPHLQLGVNEHIEAPALAGGIVRSGDFLIFIALICDPTLAADDPENPDYSWQGYSEVRYLGIASGWEISGYHPEYEDLEIREALTINGVGIHGNAIGPQMGTSWGFGQGHYGPIGTKDQIVARALTDGEPIEIVLMISALGETLAAVQLRATFKGTPDGYHLLSAEIGEVK